MRHLNAIFVILCAANLWLCGRSASAAMAIPDVNTIVPPAAATAVVKTFGITMDHRPFQGATPKGSGMDLGLEATLVHLPDDFTTSLESMGMSGGSSLAIGALPSVKLHLAKSMGPKVDIGASGLYYKGLLFWGVDLKATVASPEEGLHWALRMSYSNSSVDFQSVGLPSMPIVVGGITVGSANLKVGAQCLSPQIVASKKLDFAEPYIGAGYQWASGQIEVPVTITLTGETQNLVTPGYSASQGFVFTGVSFLVPALGFRLALEGSYSTGGMHHLGTLIGFAF